jgi:CDP-diacylglycerol--glycerol-3-phosphate 3-phosphatidyltransferase
VGQPWWCCPAVTASAVGQTYGVLNNYRATFSKATVPLGRALVRAGITADVITVIGTVGATASALVFFPRGMWFTGAFLIWMFVMFDMVDGAVARASGKSSKFGALLDSSCDRVADAAIFGALAWYFARHDQPALLLASLLCLVLGSLTSYIRARAEGLGLTASVGFAERAERLIIVLVGTGVSGSFLGIPYAQAISLWFLVGASTVTVAQRVATVWKQSKALEQVA